MERGVYPRVAVEGKGRATNTTIKCLNFTPVQFRRRNHKHDIYNWHTSHIICLDAFLPEQLFRESKGNIGSQMPVLEPISWVRWPSGCNAPSEQVLHEAVACTVQRSLNHLHRASLQNNNNIKKMLV